MVLSIELERVMGIEPTLPAWEAGVLPLNYTRLGRDSKRVNIAISLKTRA